MRAISSQKVLLSRAPSKFASYASSGSFTAPSLTPVRCFEQRFRMLWNIAAKYVGTIETSQIRPGMYKGTDRCTPPFDAYTPPILMHIHPPTSGLVSAPVWGSLEYLPSEP